MGASTSGTKKTAGRKAAKRTAAKKTAAGAKNYPVKYKGKKVRVTIPK